MTQLSLCPIQVDTTSSEPTWPNVYNRILARSCSGSTCNINFGASAAGALDMSTLDIARASLSINQRVVANDPAASVLMTRIVPPVAPSLLPRMPLNATPLLEPEIDLIRAWIAAGANP